MIRRSHKKSRGGCGQCKGRHIKCDETHPICHHCRMAERKCDFEDIKPGPANNTQSNVPEPSQEKSESTETLVNLFHMEAMLHFSVESAFPDFAFQNAERFKEILLKEALVKPWLLYQILAISLRHLAWLDSSRAGSLLPLSKSLQTQGIQLYRQHNTALVEEHFMANFMFASMLRRHHFVDTLRSQRFGFDGFLSQFLEFDKVHRGFRTVALIALPTIVDPDLQLLFETGLKLGRQTPRGTHLNDLKAAILRSSQVVHDSQDHCLKAIDLLQISIDILKDPQTEQRYTMAFVWVIMCPAEFMTKLENRKPEGLIILAYYTVLLHSARHFWQVGDCALFILQGIINELRSEWEELLRWPMTMLNSFSNLCLDNRENRLPSPGPLRGQQRTMLMVDKTRQYKRTLA